MDTEGRSTSFWKLLCAALALGLVMNLILPPWARLLLSVKLQNISGPIILFAALAAAVLFHETGHLIAALAMNFQILGGSFGPFRASRFHGEWTMQFSATSPFSASVSAVPRGIQSWRKRMLAVVAGGPAATLLTGIISAVFLLLTRQNTWWNYFFAAFTQFNFFLFVLGLIPNAPGSKVRNDARLFASLVRKTPDASEILLYHLVMQRMLAGVRPRDYPLQLIENLAVAKGRPDIDSLFAYTIAMWALDRGDVATAAAWDRRMVELGEACDPRLRNLILARSGCFDVLFGDDPTAAKAKLVIVNFKTLSPAWFKHRAKAAQWLASGNVPEALAEACRAQYSFRKHLPYYEFEKMLLSRLHERALALRTPALSISYSTHAA